MPENIKQPASALTAELIVQQLIDNGVNFVALSPGSRNGPISLALVQAEKEGLVITLGTAQETTVAEFLINSETCLDNQLFQ